MRASFLPRPTHPASLLLLLEGPTRIVLRRAPAVVSMPRLGAQRLTALPRLSLLAIALATLLLDATMRDFASAIRQPSSTVSASRAACQASTTESTKAPSLPIALTARSSIYMSMIIPRGRRDTKESSLRK